MSQEFPTTSLDITDWVRVIISCLDVVIGVLCYPRHFSVLLPHVVSHEATPLYFTALLLI